MTSNEFKDFIINNKSNAIDNYEIADIRFVDLTKDSINNFLNDKSVKLGSIEAFSLHTMLWRIKNNI